MVFFSGEKCTVICHTANHNKKVQPKAALPSRILRTFCETKKFPIEHSLLYVHFILCTYSECHRPFLSRKKAPAIGTTNWLAIFVGENHIWCMCVFNIDFLLLSSSFAIADARHSLIHSLILLVFPCTGAVFEKKKKIMLRQAQYIWIPYNALPAYVFMCLSYTFILIVNAKIMFSGS